MSSATEEFSKLDCRWHHSFTSGMHPRSCLIRDGMTCHWDDIGFWATFDVNGVYVRCGTSDRVLTKLQSLTFYENEVYYDVILAASKDDETCRRDSKEYKQAFKRAMNRIKRVCKL